MRPVVNRDNHYMIDRAALALADGVPPAGTGPAAQRVRSASLVLPEDVYFYDAAADALRLTEGSEHISV